MSTPRKSPWILSKARELFGLDLRSMTLFRIGLGAMLLADLFKRSLAFRAHYTGEGIVPREQVEDYLNVLPMFKLYMLSDAPAFQATLFAIQALAALCIIVGFRTRLVTILSFWMLVCLQRRNPFVCHTGDWLLLVLVLWAMFLPLGAAHSIDQLRKPRNPPLPGQYLSFGTLGLALQLVCFYYMAGWFKHEEPIWRSGQAVAEFTAIENYVTGFGTWLSRHPDLGRFFTHYTLALEMYGPLLLFCPFLTPYVRMVGILVFGSFHIGLHLAVYIGILELLSLVALSALLPAWFWDTLLPRVPVPAALRALWGRGLARCAALAGPGAPKVPVRPVPAWTRGLRAFEQVLAAAVLAVVLFFNHESRDKNLSISSLPIQLERFVRSTGLAQHWIIFTDLDDRPNGWYLALGERADGEVVNLFEGTEFHGIVKPRRPGAYFVNHNMRRIWHLAAQDRFLGLRPLLGDYLCREWNRHHDQRVERVIVFVMGPAGSPGTRPPMKPIVEYNTPAAAPGEGPWIAFLQQVNARMQPDPAAGRG